MCHRALIVAAHGPQAADVPLGADGPVCASFEEVRAVLLDGPFLLVVLCAVRLVAFH